MAKISQVVVTTVLNLKKPMTMEEVGKLIDEVAPLDLQPSERSRYSISTESYEFIAE